jgi:hypothetical protein
MKLKIKGGANVHGLLLAFLLQKVVFKVVFNDVA